ncbi:MAG TPA: hypothetical protein VEX36_01360 [Thermoleophilaceae bacterium]|nr:hypothetical protein [Thermoleophilaceae bacterium]
MRDRLRLLTAVAVSGVLASSVAACGDSSTPDAASTPPPPAEPEDFPSAQGKTLRDLLAEVEDTGPVLAASVSQFQPGDNRFGFALFDRARAQIADAPVALYVAPVGGGPVDGPIPASFEQMTVKPQFQSRSVAEDDEAAKSLYVARLDLPKPGRYEVLGVARLDDRVVAATPAGGPLTVKRKGPVPDVGDMAPVVHTDTEADAKGNLASIDTREPPSTMHDVDFADVAGRRPTVLLFATAALCQSRVCGPVIDVTEQVKAERGDEVAFVHQEIYRENDIAKGFRPSVGAWGLPTEPWLFAIDRDGRVAARIEGAFSAAELDKAIDAAVRG